jgi:arsenate reductase
MSGGVEITAFNERAVASLKRFGFRISATGVENPIYSVSFSSEADPIKAFSKLFDDPVNAAEQFAAVMTCSHADENCPFIPGTEKRIAVRYEDPKAFDDTPQESEMYDQRSLQIATEMAFVFSRISLVRE